MAGTATADAIKGFRIDIQDMGKKTLEMLKLAGEGFRKQDLRPFASAEVLGRQIHQREKELTDFFVRELPYHAADVGPSQELFFIPMHFERIGDNIEFLCRAMQTQIGESVPFSDRAMREIKDLSDKAIELLDCVQDAIVTQNRILMKHILAEGRRFEEMAGDYALVHQQRLIEGVCMPKASSIYLAMLDYLKGIEWHIRLIAQKLVGRDVTPVD